MRVLVACEESQEVCKAFRARGHEAYSCDIQDCSGGHPEWHIKADTLEMIKMKWDLIIAHPPCTYLTTCGSPLVFNKDGSIKNRERYEKGLEAADFFMRFINADQPKIAVENPFPIGKLFVKYGGGTAQNADHRTIYVWRSMEEKNSLMAERASPTDNDGSAGYTVGLLG